MGTNKPASERSRLTIDRAQAMRRAMPGSPRHALGPEAPEPLVPVRSSRCATDRCRSSSPFPVVPASCGVSQLTASPSSCMLSAQGHRAGLVPHSLDRLTAVNMGGSTRCITTPSENAMTMVVERPRDEREQDLLKRKHSIDSGVSDAGLRFGLRSSVPQGTPTNRNGTLPPTEDTRAQWMSGNI